MFQDVKIFKRVHKKYDACFIKDRKKFIENEASLLELALNVSNLSIYMNTKLNMKKKVIPKLYFFGYIEKIEKLSRKNLQNISI